MRTSLPPTIAETLTAAERAAPFAMTAPDPEPLPSPTRVPLLIEGDTLREIDPGTGQIRGEVAA